MTTQAIARRRRPRGLHSRRTDGEPQPKRLPEYLEADEVDALIRASEDPRAKLLMLTQWRAGLRVSEALALDVSDLSLDSDWRSKSRCGFFGVRLRLWIPPKNGHNVHFCS